MRRIVSQADIDEGTAYLRQRCNVMEAMLRACPEIPLRLSAPGFEGLASIIVSQQVSKASADAIFTRLKQAIDPLEAETFLAAGEEGWRSAGLSRPKQRTLAAVSEAVLDKRIDLDDLHHLAPDEARTRLVALHGIGPWTAEVYLMFCAGHADIFPAGDLALQEAIRMGFKSRKRPDEKTASKRALKWAPWRSVAARILWAYYGSLRRDATPG